MEIIFAAATMILVYFIVFQTLFSQQNFAMNPPLDQLRRRKFSYEEAFEIEAAKGNAANAEDDKVRRSPDQVSSLGMTKRRNSRDSKMRPPSQPSLSSKGARCMGAPRYRGASRSGYQIGSRFASRATAA